MAPVLSIEGITKTFTDGESICRTLDGISFEVEENEIVCIMGPSGCGKSTLLRIINDLEHADTGTIREASKDKTGKPTTAMVFQDHALFPWLTVYDNIVYGLRLSVQKLSEEEIAKRAEGLLSLTHLDSFAKAYPHQLSGGMKQRASVARALAIKPSVLLMDEPFSALDPFTRRELEDEVMRIREDLRTTILLVTHNPTEAIYLADRIIVLSARPAVVAGILYVDIPHPREMANPEFLKIRETIIRMVRGKEGLRE
ncbi:ABC transporter ATP-binding protein [Methanoregula sp.]|uniref:ABC transporter ATP-binding protein n=1 Tax=Methanoregula sp. TaxID=2052170 RepID=UPI00356189C8